MDDSEPEEVPTVGLILRERLNLTVLVSLEVTWVDFGVFACCEGLDCF